jgi:serine/threonine protein kinase
VQVERDEQNPTEAKITGKITDFGLSYIMRSELDKSSSQMSAALRWRAPEMSEVKDDDEEGRKNYMEKADVWSFALTALEVSYVLLSISASNPDKLIAQVAQNQNPFPTLTTDKSFMKAWASEPETLIGLLPVTNPNTPFYDTAFGIMTECWRLRPVERPQMITAQTLYREARTSWQH